MNSENHGLDSDSLMPENTQASGHASGSVLVESGQPGSTSAPLLSGGSGNVNPFFDMPESDSGTDEDPFRNTFSPAQPYPQAVFGVESRLSECALWDMLKHYYDRMGVEAWNGTVPCFVTNSAFLAESYADMIIHYLRDNIDRLDPAEPVYILEMAAGLGRLAHLLVRELAERMTRFSALKEIRFCYIMADFTENNVNFWRTQPKLQPWIEKGMLDFALFQPEDDSEIHTLCGEREISARTLKNPLIAIANYLFDTLQQDVFRVIDKQLYEGLVTLESSWEYDPDVPARFGEISTQYRFQPVSTESYYGDPGFDALLEEYRNIVQENGTFLFPLGGLRLLRNLHALSNENLMLLSSDKCYGALEHMTCYDQHNFAVHGSISYMVNYDAIGRYFRRRGGWFLQPAHWSGLVLTVCCGTQRGSSGKNEQLNYYFDYYVSGSNAISSVAYLHPDEPKSINRCLSLLKLSLADPRTLCLLGNEIVETLPNAGIEQKRDLVRLMEESWEKYYFYRGEYNLPYWLAEIYQRLDLHEKSLFYLDESLKCYDEYSWEYYQMKGRNYAALNQWEQALEMYDRVLQIKPDCSTAYQAREAIRTLLQSMHPQALPSDVA